MKVVKIKEALYVMHIINPSASSCGTIVCIWQQRLLLSWTDQENTMIWSPTAEDTFVLYEHYTSYPVYAGNLIVKMWTFRK